MDVIRDCFLELIPLFALIVSFAFYTLVLPYIFAYGILIGKKVKRVYRAFKTALKEN